MIPSPPPLPVLESHDSRCFFCRAVHVPAILSFGFALSRFNFSHIFWAWSKNLHLENRHYTQTAKIDPEIDNFRSWDIFIQNRLRVGIAIFFGKRIFQIVLSYRSGFESQIFLYENLLDCWCFRLQLFYRANFDITVIYVVVRNLLKKKVEKMSLAQLWRSWLW